MLTVSPSVIRNSEKLIECDTLPTTSLVSPQSSKKPTKKLYQPEKLSLWLLFPASCPAPARGARIAAEDYEGKVFVVDSLNATIGNRFW